MKIILASHNKNKIKELEMLLSDSGLKDVTVLSLSDIGFTGEIVENGSSFEENAMIKATAVKYPGAIIAADDSGLSVNALNGAPGIYSARYAGEGAGDADNNALLLKNLHHTTDRRASFISVVACVLPDGRSFTVRGECPGVILGYPRGHNGFGYDPLFLIPEIGKTFAELTDDQKNSISHRGRAMRAFAAELKEMLK